MEDHIVPANRAKKGRGRTIVKERGGRKVPKKNYPDTLHSATRQTPKGGGKKMKGTKISYEKGC